MSGSINQNKFDDMSDELNALSGFKSEIISLTSQKLYVKQEDWIWQDSNKNPIYIFCENLNEWHTKIWSKNNNCSWKIGKNIIRKKFMYLNQIRTRIYENIIYIMNNIVHLLDNYL